MAACDSRPTSSPTTPSPSPQPSQAPQQTASAQPEEPAAPAAVEPAKTVNISAESEENRLVKAEVLDRIDVMPKLSDDEKDKLYVQVERARGMGKLITIPFKSGKRALSQADIGAIKTSLALPQFDKFISDPTVVFVVLGFADKAGDPGTNLALSRERAEAVVSALKNQCGVLNVTHSVGMGGSEIFGTANLDKNRVVEVWAVLP